jgi:hypothetical protein
MQARSSGMIEVLRQRGVELEVLHLTDFQQDSTSAIGLLLGHRPDFLTAPNFNYLLIAAAALPCLLHLDIPIVAMWDDPLGALTIHADWEKSAQVWEPAPTSRFSALFQSLWERVRTFVRGPQAPRLPAPPYFRQLMRNPTLLHMSADSGHIRAAEELGLVEPGRTAWYPYFAPEPFFRMGDTADTIEPERDLAFCGNVYLSQLEKEAFWQSEWHRAFTEDLVRQKVVDGGRSAWELLRSAVESVPGALRDEFGMSPDRKEFWYYYRFLAWCAFNSLWRVGMLQAVDHPIHLFGLFADPQTREVLGRYPNLCYAGHVDHFVELPRVYASTRINLCISNGLLFQGIPSKLFDCLASGGFALCDPKDDLVRLFGPTIVETFVRNPQELNDKIHYFLPRPEKRRAIVHELRQTLRQRCTLSLLFDDVLERVRRHRCSGQAA